MRYGIFSDIHANLEALQAVRNAYESERIDKFLCLGDIVGYGADPDPAIDLLKGFCSDVIAGNHDWAVCGKLTTKYFNREASAVIDWTRETISISGLKYLKGLPLIYKDENLVCVHSSLTEPEKFYYLIRESDIRRDVFLAERNISFVGHTHVPAIFKVKKEKVLISPVLKCVLEKGSSYSVNVGSVGQPRDGVCEAPYAVFDTKKNLVEIKRIEYNIAKAQNKIRKAGLPGFLADRLSQGR